MLAEGSGELLDDATGLSIILGKSIGGVSPAGRLPDMIQYNQYKDCIDQTILRIVINFGNFEINTQPRAT